MTPDDLVAYQKEYKDYDIKDQVQLWMREGEARGLRQNTLNRLYSTVNNFFRYNRAGLPDDVFKMHSKTPAVAGPLTMEKFRQVVLASNPLYQAVFMCLLAGIMGAGELLYWSDNGYEELVDQLERGERIIRANQSGRKLYANIMPFYNWIGGDALNQLRVYLDDYRPEGPGPIFITKQLRGLNYRAMRNYWTRKLKELGLSGSLMSSRRPLGMVRTLMRLGISPVLK